jgi:hypothetical protein
MFEENETWRKPRIKGHSQTFVRCRAGCLATLIFTYFKRATKEDGNERKGPSIPEAVLEEPNNILNSIYISRHRNPTYRPAAMEANVSTSH